MAYEPGTRVGGLLIERELGRGAFGVVYLARDTLIGRAVALKVLSPRDDVVAEELLTEARLIGNLSSPHIVTLYRVHNRPDGAWMLEMEFVPGGSLYDRVCQGPLPPPQALGVLRGICRGLDAAHGARIVHGDIKPENVLFGDGDVVKLADFGIARIVDAAGASRRADGKIVGTPFYMAPEVVGGAGLRIASDIWSVGVLAYEMLTGDLPFQADTVGELFASILAADPKRMPASVPEPLADLVFACLREQPDARPPSAAHLVAEIDRIVRGDAGLRVAGEAPERPTNVGPLPTSFVGRLAELLDLVSIVREGEHRLITMTGPGGIGKTRLAQHVCLGALGALEGGAWFADLSQESDAAGIGHAVAEALGAPHAGAADPVALVTDVLRLRRPLLLVLDNFEQVLDHASATVGVWRAAAPHVRLLVTSRAILNLPGELHKDLGPLAAPATADASLAVDAALRFDAVRLFADRAEEARPGFTLEGCVADVVRICQDLDGMPLAIELAAARVRIMRPAQIAARLDEKFKLLRSPRRDTAMRQSTLEAAIEWSYDLLNVWEKSAYLQACWFRDGFSLDAAETVLDLSEFDDAPFGIDVAQSLREKSLLRAFDAGQETRLDMYRAIREFGERRWQRLASPAAQEGLARRHAAFYVELAEDANRTRAGVRHRGALARVGLEIGNLERAHAWALDAGETDLAVRTVLAAAETIKVHRPALQLLPLLDACLSALGEATSAERAHLLVYRSAVHELCGAWDEAVAESRQAIDVARGTGDAVVLTAALLQAGEMRRVRGDLPGALELLTECESLARSRGDEVALASIVGQRGMVLGPQGDLDAAFRCFTQAETLATRVGDDQTAALHLCNQGVVHERHGDPQRALDCYARAEDIGRRGGDRLRVAIAIGNQGTVLAQQGRLDAALERLREAEGIARDLGALQRVANLVGNRAVVHEMRGEIDREAECAEEAERIARAIGDPVRIARSLWQRGKLVAHDDPESALILFNEAEEIGRSADDHAIVAQSRSLRGDLLRTLHRHAEAGKALQAALREFDAMGLRRRSTFKTLAALALLAADTGDVDAAREHARRALELAAHLHLVDDPAVDELRGLVG